MPNRGWIGVDMKLSKLLVVLACLFSALVARGQDWVIDDSETKFVTANTDLGNGVLAVGNTASDNGLVVNQGIFFGATNGYVGVAAGSQNNSMVLQTNSAALFRGDLNIGYGGANNSLTVKQGAYVASVNGALGNASDNNSALVSGEYAGWTNSGNLYVGYGGSGNTLDVADGARVDANSIYVGTYGGANSNSVDLSNGSMHAKDKLVVGNASSWNSLDASGGSSLSSASAWVGAGTNANNNVVTISDGGTLWEVDGTLNIGTNGNSGNIVEVKSSGWIEVDELSIKGTGNGFVLGSGGQLTVNSDFNASMAGFTNNSQGILNVGGKLTGFGNKIDKGRSLGIRGEWDMAGADVGIGAVSDGGNRLDVEDGGWFSADNLNVGTASNSSANLLWVGDYGSSVEIADTLRIGSTNGTGNEVQVKWSAQMTVGNDIIIAGSNNTLTVEQAGLLRVENDFDASMEGFVFGEGGKLETTGTLAGMTNTLEGGRSVGLDGGGWDLGAGTLTIGGQTSYNSIQLRNGGMLSGSNAVIGAGSASAENYAMIEGTGSVWSVSDSLVVGGEGSANEMYISGGGVVASGNGSVGVDGSDNEISITGAGSKWIVTNQLNFGVNGSNNRLFVEDGGFLSSSNAVVGGAGLGNTIRVRGAGSQWVNSGNLDVGGSGAGLIVSGAGHVDVGQKLSLLDGASLSLATNGTVSTYDFFQGSGAALYFNSITNVVDDPGAALVTVTNSAEFEAGATVAFLGAVEDVEVGVTNSRKIVASAGLVVDGVTNATGSELDVLVAEDYSSLLDSWFTSVNDVLYMNIHSLSTAESAGFEPGTQMYDIANEIDRLSTNGNRQAINQRQLLGQYNGSVQNAQLTQFYDRSVPTYMHMEGLFEGMRQVKNRGIMPDTYWPVGAYGPHLYGEQVQGWVKGYGTWGQQDGSGEFSGYDQSVYGVVLGFDKAFGDLLAGVAGGYSSSDISQDDGDSSKSGLGYGLLYGSWGTSSWFADASIAYGLGSVENDSGTIFDATSEADMSQFAYYIGGGKEMVFRNDSVFLTPTLALLGGNYAQDGYTDVSANAVARQVDDYNRWSLKSELGVKSVFRKEFQKSVLMPEVHANWLHEFNSDADRVGYTLAGGSGNYSYGMVAPVENLFELGAGLSWWMAGQSGSVYEWAIGFDGRFGDGYTAAALNARLLVEF